MGKSFIYKLNADQKSIFKEINKQIEVSGDENIGEIRKNGVKIGYTMTPTVKGTKIEAKVLSKPFYVSTGRVKSELDKLHKKLTKKLTNSTR